MSLYFLIGRAALHVCVVWTARAELSYAGALRGATPVAYPSSSFPATPAGLPLRRPQSLRMIASVYSFVEAFPPRSPVIVLPSAIVCTTISSRL